MDGTIEIGGETRPIARLDAEAMRLLVEAGAFHDRRVEMIDGVMIEMAPSNDPHAEAFIETAFQVRMKAGRNWRVLGDVALYLTNDLMFAPDIVVLPKGVASHEASGSDIALLIEISDSTLRYDLGAKARLYASHGVADYWVVDLPNGLLHIHRDPDEAGYGDVKNQPLTAPVTALLAPELTVTFPEALLK